MARARRQRAGGGAGESGGNSDRASLYQEVTDRIITELEAGRVLWVQPWDSAQAGLGLPANAATGRHYSGINILILWAAVIGKAYPSQSWLTFRQALGLGGAVRKGERGTTVVYADRFIPEAEKERARRDGDDPSFVPFLKRFTVFNVAQCAACQAARDRAPCGGAHAGDRGAYSRAWRRGLLCAGPGCDPGAAAIHVLPADRLLPDLLPRARP
jgi:hypothetical protein